MLNKLVSYADDKPYITIGLMIFISIGFIILGHYHQEMIQNKLKNEIIKVPEFILDWWSVSHFLFFGLFGFLFPDNAGKFFLIGAGWELIEDYFSNLEKDKLFMECLNKNQVIDIGITDVRKISCNRDEMPTYWYGKWDDIVVNTLGYFLGQEMRKYYNKGLYF